MNTLELFIVDGQGVVEKVIRTTDDANFVPEDNGRGGCETDYSTTVTLRTGAKTIYAFANLDGHADVEGKNLGEVLGGGDVRVTSLSIGDFADRVALFEGGSVGTASFDKTRFFTLDRTVGATPMDLYGTGDDGQAVLSSGGKGMPEIYVNETDGSTPFRITLTIDGDEMAGKTVATAVPRNHYLPLALNLSDFRLAVTAYVAPIGGYPVAVMTEPSLTDHYEVDVPEGCHFEVEGTFGRTETADMPVTSWAWTVPQASAGLVAVENETAIPLVGWLTALPGKQATLEFSVTAPRVKKGTLTLTTVPLGDMDGYGLVNRRSLPGWTENAQKYERVNLSYN